MSASVGSGSSNNASRRHGIGLAQAFRTMTILPAFGCDAESVASQLYFFPLVGIVVGLLGAALVLLLLVCISAGGTLGSVQSLVCGVLWTVWMAYATRAFHLDGLADTFDGFGGGWTVERRLEIMKDSRIGSFGVVAIVSCLALKASLAALAVYDGFLYGLVWSCAVARCMVVFACCFSKYAKPQGLSYELVSQARPRHFVASLVWVVALAFAFPSLYGLGLRSALRTAVSFALAFAAALYLLHVSKRKIGGVTGDVLGACCELCEVASLAGFVFARF